MFQKPAFGSNATSGFGSFNSAATTASPFGGFKPTTSTFGTATPTQPTAGGGLFSSNTSGGLFGNTGAAPSTSTFGANTSGFGFGTAPASGGLFGNTTSTGLFGTTQNNSAFGAKPAGFGFGSTATTGTTGGGLFGTTPSTGTGLFGQQNNPITGGGLFGSNTTGAFGQQQQQTGTGHVKYNPVVGTDMVVKSGTSSNINIKHHCITCMKEYENKSLEELRLEDYVAGRKGSTAGVFGGFQQPTENKPLFGATGFGQPAPTATSAPSMFGGGGLGTTTGFGQTNTFSFGGGTQNTTNTTGLFGANKPTFGATTTPGTGLFGAATTQAPTFGTNTSTFGFGSNTQNQTGGLFGAKPATTGFGAATTGGAAFGGGLFGATTTSANTTPAFGNLSGGFGANTSTTGGLFGANNSTFGKPATSQPTFGFNTQPIGAGAGLGAGLGANTFQAKPAAPAFGNLGANTMFQQPATNTTFKTGLDSGLGGGLFSNTSALGGSAFGLGGMNMNNSAMANNTLSGSSAAGNVHEQMLTLAARPYGDSPLFKDLLPDSSSTAEDVLKPTNPAAMKAVLDRSQTNYRVTSPTGVRLKLQPRATLTHDKKSLFDGLEESDSSLEDKLCLKPSRKRLVLRSHTNSDTRSDLEHLTHHTNRSLEEPQSQRDMNGPNRSDKENTSVDQLDKNDNPRAKNYSDSGNLEVSSDRHGSWLNSSKPLWGDKEKPMDGEPTQRLYPILDKELPNQGPERRASWLTTKPLRKPLGSGNPDAVENSVRELGVRHDSLSHDKENVDTLSGTSSLQFCRHRGGLQPGCSKCEKIAHQIGGLYVSEEEHVAPREAPPHPTGVKLTRPGYYTIPSLDDMINFMRPDGSCIVPHLTIGRKNYGNVYYDCEVDVAGIDLDALVHFLNKEVIVYPEDAVKPPVGEGLNRRAIVTLDRIWPRDKTEKRPITDPDRLLKMDYEGKLRRVCDKHDTKFIEYRPQTGSWVFRVEHFSKYGLTDSDEEDDPTPDVLKRQLVNQSLQTSAAQAPKPPVVVPTPGSSVLSGGLLAAEDSVFSRHTPLAALNGVAKGFEMDTTEDNTESQSLYQDNRAFGVKSPTSELARLEHRQSHNVQLMKASLYADTEIEDDVSVSTGDQLVPLSAPLVKIGGRTASPAPIDIHHAAEDAAPPVHTDEITMKPLIIRPHTIVLKYHRKVPPFKNTIAGRLGAAYIADMSVCRARHSRIGFGPAGSLAYVTSYDSVCDLPRNAELCDLGKYVRGRAAGDWSESVVTRMAIGQPDSTYNIEEILGPHLETLLQWSTVPAAAAGRCPQLRLLAAPRDRLAILRSHLEHARKRDHRAAFGVSGAYCYEVWKLCDALWGADLENDGVPGTSELSIVNRHKKLLEWFAAAVAEATDEELSKPRQGETEDETDGHSARVWTLLLGGRVLEACKVAREHGDLNMATLIAQAAGDPIFRSLISRQLALWRECGADALVAAHRRAALQLLAGAPPLLELANVDWLRALHATAKYLCPQVPTLEQIIRTYEGFFTTGDEEPDLSVLLDDEVTMRLPLPPYEAYCRLADGDEKPRNVLDLRYELLRARAFNARPKLRPAAYTPDPFDYSLCFLLGTWFGNPTRESVTGAADQLAAAGAWHLAVHVLAYHPDDAARGHLIRGVLYRHAPAIADTPELKSRLDLIKKLGVPEEWLLLAQAHRAKYEHLPAIEAQHLVGAGQWNAAHKVLLEELLPVAVLSDDLQSISPLLQKLNEAAQRHEVSGWETGGQALYHYLHVCDEIRGLVSSAEAQRDRSEVHARLEALRPTVAAACRALGGLHPKTPQHAAARAEMGARLVQLALAAGEPAHHLAALLKALKLPPDCTAHAQHKITTDLAEQASELCIESATSSPQSSHHRAAVAR